MNKIGMTNDNKKSPSKNVVPLYSTLVTAERSKTDKRTDSAVPSDDAVERLRKWSEEKQV